MRPGIRHAIGMAATCLAVLGGLLVLPHDPARRWRALRDTDYVKAAWIDDRLERSATPIDVAFIGTSHTLLGVDAALVEAAATGNGATLHAANLALPHPGDDLHWLIGQRVLAAKHPRVLVLETMFLQPRASHPAFARLADVGELLTAPLGDPGQVSAWLSLPHRQWTLFWDTLTGPTDRSLVVPDHWDDTYRITYRAGGRSPPRFESPDPDELVRHSQIQIREQVAKAAEYARWGGLTFHYNQFYLVRLLELTRAAGVRVVFLYLPSFGTSRMPVSAALLSGYGDIWTPPATVLGNPRNWSDTEHLNRRGAEALSMWLGDRLAAAWPDPTMTAAR